MEREFLEGLGLEETVIGAILDEHGKTVAAHAQELEQLRFDSMVEAAVQRAGGRSSKAICALLDLPALRSSEKPEAAVEAALTQLKKDSGYLFQQTVPPRFAPGTGTRQGAAADERPTLAQALRERMLS